MAPRRSDDSDSSTPPSSPPAIAKRNKFEDEEDDSDVIDDWEADDSEAEREKAKKAAEAEAKAKAEAAANKKSKAQRVEERRMENMRKKMEADEESSEEESESERRARLRRTEQDSDLKHAEDLFSNIGVTKRSTSKAIVTADPSDPSKAIDLSTLSIFKPATKDQFGKLRETLLPIFQASAKQPHYVLFMQEFTKQALRDLPSDQIKKIASGITTLSNEKMKEEKAAEKGGKKSRAAKTKTTLNAARNTSHVDTTLYDDLADDDFM